MVIYLFILFASSAHWFDLPPFYKEAQRVLKKNGVVAIWGYSICQLDNPVAHERMQHVII
jgi:spermidine synthase